MFADYTMPSFFARFLSMHPRTNDIATAFRPAMAETADKPPGRWRLFQYEERSVIIDRFPKYAKIFL